jgi:hypothetical protein
MTILWENQRNGNLRVTAGAHCRSLGCARDDKWRAVTLMRSRRIGWTERNSRSLVLRSGPTASRSRRDDKFD